MKALAAALVLVTVVTYLPAMRGGFIWDDDDHLTQNAAVRSPAGLTRIWSSLGVSRYYPLTLTSFWAQYRLWGLRPWSYHAVNVALHAVDRAVVVDAAAPSRCPQRVGGRSGVGRASGQRGNRGVDHRTEEHAIDCSLSFGAVDVFAIRGPRAAVRLRPRDCVRSSRDVEQTFDGRVAGRDVVVRVVAARPVEARGLVANSAFVALALGMSLLTIVEQRHHIQNEGTTEWSLTAVQRLALAGQAVWFLRRRTYLAGQFHLHLSALGIAGGHMAAVGRAGGGRECAVAFPSKTLGARLHLWVGCFVVALLPVLGFFDIYFFVYSFVRGSFPILASMALITLVVSAIPRNVALALALVLAGLTWKQAQAYVRARKPFGATRCERILTRGWRTSI